ncbi:MAG: UpxY family transcription antiterminator [Candidatus Acidiferrales bacterium]
MSVKPLSTSDLVPPSLLTPPSQAWHALYTRHQHEKVVDRILRNKGFETFLPLCATLSQWKDRAKLVHQPLFPCYVFVRAEKSQWMNILVTPGVQMIVPCGDAPAVVPEEEIRAVHRLLQNSEFVEPHPFLKFGDRVRVRSGPLVGVEGFLVRKKNLYRLVVCIEILGKAASIEIDAVLIERTGERRSAGIKLNERGPQAPYDLSA